jgi:hypothetical protein
LPKPPAGCPDSARRKRINHRRQYLHDPRDQPAIRSIEVLTLALLARRRKAKNFGWLDRTGLREQSVGDRKYQAMRRVRSSTNAKRKMKAESLAELVKMAARLRLRQSSADNVLVAK